MGIILIPYVTFLPNFVSFAVSVAELDHGEKSHTQSLNHPAYFMPREPKLALRSSSLLISESQRNDQILCCLENGNPLYFADFVFTARAYARAVLGVVILSVRLIVCLSHAWIVTKLNDALQIF